MENIELLKKEKTELTKYKQRLENQLKEVQIKYRRLEEKKNKIENRISETKSDLKRVNKQIKTQRKTITISDESE